MTHQLDRQRQELHFLAATQALDWRRVGAALAALPEGGGERRRAGRMAGASRRRVFHDTVRQ